MANKILSFSVQFELKKSFGEILMGRKRDAAWSKVNIRAEMLPDAANRVTLSTGRNSLSQPLSQVDFRFKYAELAKKSWQVFSNEILKSGLGRPMQLLPKLTPNGGGHLIGTTRMGHSATDSVIDGNCKVHTTNNLYVAGSSIFPAGGAANPTYTIVAMSLRLGDHLASLNGANLG